jgi:precorrin-2 dehydrogenase/sirohydrochlorin ferrochelatase
MYPIFLNLLDKTSVVIGGGAVAERKIETLIEYGAKIRVISPQLGEKIHKWAEDGIIQLKQAEFCPEDLEGAFIVFIATDNRLLNQQIADLCRNQGILVNAVDDPPNCDFYVPSLLKRNSLSVAISTEGKSPLFAARLRQELEELIPEAYGDFVEMMGVVREEIKLSNLKIEERKELFQFLLNSDILDLLRCGQKQKAEERMKECISSWLG